MICSGQNIENFTFSFELYWSSDEGWTGIDREN